MSTLFYPLYLPRLSSGLLAVLVLAVLLLCPELLWAGEVGSSLFVGKISNFFSGLATRSRVIQVCIVAMSLALFIILKKFADVSTTPRR